MTTELLVMLAGPRLERAWPPVRLAASRSAGAGRHPPLRCGRLARPQFLPVVTPAEEPVRLILRRALALRSEFTIEDAHMYDQCTALRWAFSHVRRYWYFAPIALALFLSAWLVYAGAQVLIGRAAEEIITPTWGPARCRDRPRHPRPADRRRPSMLFGYLPPRTWRRPASRPTPARSCTPACLARARPSTTASGPATSWRGPPTTPSSSAA